MKLKKTLIVSIMLLTIMIGVASASEDMSSDVADVASDEFDDLSVVDDVGDYDLSDSNDEPTLESDKDTLSADSQGTFSDIQTMVNGASDDGTIELSGNYIGSGSHITINKPLTINGNGATLNAQGKSRAFYITANNVTLKNINFVNCSYSSNYGDARGGAVYSTGSHSSIVNCMFTICNARSYDGDSFVAGGAVYLAGSYASVKNCKFINCSATNDYSNNYYYAKGTSSYGGALYLDGSADHCSVLDCSFENSTARASSYSQDVRGWSSDTSCSSSGGSIYWKGANGSIKNCSFINSLVIAKSTSSHSTVSGCSTATSNGGAIFWEGDKGSIMNCSFINTQTNASAVAGYGNTAIESSTYGYGGAIYLKGSSKSVSNCNFVNTSVNLKSGCVNIEEGGINWDVSGKSSRYSVHGYGGAIYFGSEGSVSGSSFINCAVNGNYNKVIANVKSISDCTFKPKISTTITAPKVTVTYKVSKKLTVTLKDASGNALKSKKVTIKVGSISKTLTTNDKGQVSVDVSGLVPKTYTATISFAGDNNYQKSSSTAKVTVKKATPKLTAKKKTFKLKVKVKNTKLL